MATRKTDTSQNRTPAKNKANESKASEDKAPTEDQKASESYADQANKIAVDARAFSEDTRAALDDLVDRCNDLNQTDPGDDHAAADAVRRLPMACSDAAAALQGLAQAAAELASRTVR
ncbi:hypothetical protein [Actinomadura sp. WMMA1423]|uniref:hypothetical protein n=1 Tax=Actinomadura sp. WMMA1423 TaxID=2591108 RepID=UPI00114766E4|nr:hypothetical protein [Actinomadura sp. WMMA1423]